MIPVFYIDVIADSDLNFHSALQCKITTTAGGIFWIQVRIFMQIVPQSVLDTSATKQYIVAQVGSKVGWQSRLKLGCTMATTQQLCVKGRQFFTTIHVRNLTIHKI